MPPGKNHKPGCACKLCTRYRPPEAIPEPTGDGRDAVVSPKPAPKPKVVALSGKRRGRPPGTKNFPETNPGYVNADLPEVFHTHSKSIRERVGQWVALRALKPGITYQEAADQMGISRAYLNTAITRATKQGWLKFDDPLARLNHEIIPKVVDNLSHFLDLKDRTVTVETAKGTIFKVFQAAEGVNDAPRVGLVLKIEAIDSGNAKIIEGQIVGRPKEIGS